MLILERKQTWVSNTIFSKSGKVQFYFLFELCQWKYMESVMKSTWAPYFSTTSYSTYSSWIKIKWNSFLSFSNMSLNTSWIYNSSLLRIVICFLIYKCFSSSEYSKIPWGTKINAVPLSKTLFFFCAWLLKIMLMWVTMKRIHANSPFIRLSSTKAINSDRASICTLKGFRHK